MRLFEKVREEMENKRIDSSLTQISASEKNVKENLEK